MATYFTAHQNGCILDKMFNSQFRAAHKSAFDVLSFLGFLALIIIGAMFINAFIFRSFNVIGPSMEPTLVQDDRLVVNKLPHTWATLQGKQYQPNRGEIIVFRNPLYTEGRVDEFVVKRVIGLPGERVVVHDGSITVYNDQNPNGFNPDQGVEGPKSPTTGDVDRIVPPGELFVSGDNRVGNHSLDSRNGMSTVPLANIQGPVSLRLFPFDKMRFF
jgi:signal peptidase I